MLSDEIYVCELEWYDSISEYNVIGYATDVEPEQFDINNLKFNQLYKVGQKYCKSPEYLLVFDYSKKAHIYKHKNSEHLKIHNLVSGGAPLNLAIEYTQL